MPQIKAIFFDLDETLIENKMSVTEVFSQVYADFKHTLGENTRKVFFTELSLQAKHVWAHMFDGARSPEGQLTDCFEHAIAATKAVDSDNQRSFAIEMMSHFVSLSSHNVRFQDNAEHVLSDLRSMGYTTGIITNGIKKVQLGKVHQLGVDKMVDYVTVSAQARAHKPLRQVFELALKRANVDADASIMVGDHPTNDVAGSIRAGMTGVYYNPKRHTIEDAFAKLAERPNHTIHRLADVLKLL